MPMIQTDDCFLYFVVILFYFFLLVLLYLIARSPISDLIQVKLIINPLWPYCIIQFSLLFFLFYYILSCIYMYIFLLFYFIVIYLKFFVKFSNIYSVYFFIYIRNYLFYIYIFFKLRIFKGNYFYNLFTVEVSKMKWHNFVILCVILCYKTSKVL